MTESTTNQQKDRVSKVRAKPARPSLLHRKCACGKHSDAEREDNRLQRTAMLQRTCACGQHTLGGSSCPSCRRERLSAAVGTHDGAAAGEGWLAAESQPLVAEWGRASTVPIRPASRLSGGEGSGEDDSETLIGGELSIASLTTSSQAGQPLQRQDDKAKDKASLTYTTLSAPESLGCGGFRSQVRWGLKDADKNTNGFVVQKVSFDLAREKCSGGDNNYKTTYWEAWQVRSGKIYIGTSNSPHGSDTFQVPPAPDHKGSCYEGGWAKYMPNYEAPKSWGNVPEALSLPSTTSQPKDWSDDGTLHRYMRNTFDCCEQSDMGDFKSSG